jgi:hypothetical protein
MRIDALRRPRQADQELLGLPGAWARVNPHLAFLLSIVYDGSLAPAHRQDLEESGLTKEMIQGQFLRSVPPQLIGPLLGFDIPAITSALLFPFRSPAGGFMDHVRMKIFPTLVKVTREGVTRWVPDAEQTPEDLKHETVKYLQSKGREPRLYFVAACLRDVVAGDEPLWLVEGEKKAIAVAQLGLPAVGFCGVEGWHRQGTTPLLPDFDGLRLRDRIIELVPDGDYQTNLDVKRAVQRLGGALLARGARPRVVLLPSELPR